MPDQTGDYASVGQEWLSTLDADEDQLTSLRKSMTDVRVAMMLDVVGMGALSAYEFAKAEAWLLWTWTGLTEERFEAIEPEQVEGGVMRIGVLIGVTALDPAEAVRSACAVLANRTWSEPAVRTIAEHQFSYWAADVRPARGPVRIEVHAAPGLSPITERQRQELLDNPDFGPLHDILRMP
jgi:hypothetical protein